jgi:hypothetical protein
MVRGVYAARPQKTKAATAEAARCHWVRGQTDTREINAASATPVN